MKLFTFLPEDVQKEIASNMICETLVNFCKTNKKNNIIDNDVWLQLLKRDFYFYKPVLKSAFVEYTHFYMYFNKYISNFGQTNDTLLLRKLLVKYISMYEADEDYPTNLYSYQFTELNNIERDIFIIVDNPIAPPFSYIKLKSKIDIIHSILRNMITNYTLPEE